MKIIITGLAAGLVLSAAALAAGSGTAAAPTPGCQSIAQIVSSRPDLSTLYNAVQVSQIDNGPPVGVSTLFAPTNAAFARLPAGTLGGLLGHPSTLKTVLLYHLLPSRKSARQLSQLSTAKTDNGASVRLLFAGRQLYVNTARVIQADLPACNGVVHLVNRVLMPPR